MTAKRAGKWANADTDALLTYRNTVATHAEPLSKVTGEELYPPAGALGSREAAR